MRIQFQTQGPPQQLITLTDIQQGFHPTDFRVNSEKVVQLVELLRAPEISAYGRGNRRTVIEFTVEKVYSSPAVAGREIMERQSILEEDGVLLMTAHWGFQSSIRRCRGTMQSFDSSYVVGASAVFRYRFVGGKITL